MPNYKTNSRERATKEVDHRERKFTRLKSYSLLFAAHFNISPVLYLVKINKNKKIKYQNSPKKEKKEEKSILKNTQSLSRKCVELDTPFVMT